MRESAKSWVSTVWRCVRGNTAFLFAAVSMRVRLLFLLSASKVGGFGNDAGIVRPVHVLAVLGPLLRYFDILLHRR